MKNAFEFRTDHWVYFGSLFSFSLISNMNFFSFISLETVLWKPFLNGGKMSWICLGVWWGCNRKTIPWNYTGWWLNKTQLLPCAPWNSQNLSIKHLEHPRYFPRIPCLTCLNFFSLAWNYFCSLLSHFVISCGMLSHSRVCIRSWGFERPHKSKIANECDADLHSFAGRRLICFVRDAKACCLIREVFTLALLLS